MTLPGRSAIALAVLLALAGCQRRPDGVVRPFGFTERVTIGKETRIAGGPAAVLLYAGRVSSPEQLPQEVELPAYLDSGAPLLLHARAVPLMAGGRRSAAPQRRRTITQAPRRGPEGATVEVERLAEVARGGLADVTIHAVPARLARAPRHQTRLRVPPSARLRVGYGVRDDVVGRVTGRARFRVDVRDRGGRTHRLLERELDAAEAAAQGWQKDVLDLSPFAGQTVTLALEAEGTGTRALPVWGGPVVLSGPSRRPNIVLISLDTLRARSLPTYGYGRATAPFLDRIAREGAVFEQAMTVSATTAPAHMSLFTGVYPEKHGIRIGFEGKAGEYPTIARRLRLSGYHTAAFTENGFLIKDFGFIEGFTRYTENPGPPGQPPGEAPLTFSQARKFLTREPPQPFFLFVHTYEVHSPHDPPPPYAALFAGDGQPGHADPAVRRRRDDYDREIRLVDDQLRLFFDELDARGLADQTVVVITSDHGEEFGEHGFLQHSSTLFDEVMHIPLVFWAPGRIAAGQRIGGVVSLVDLSPTLLDLAGLRQPDDQDGISLLPALGGNPLPERAVFAHASGLLRQYANGDLEEWPRSVYAWRTATSKYISHRPEKGEPEPPLFFDLAADPEERSPIELAAEEEARLALAIDSYLDGRPRDAAIAIAAVDPPADIDPGLRDRLRQLGYVQ